MSATTYLLKADDMFWTGSGWSAEYPDARLFSSRPLQGVIDRATASACANGWNGTALETFRNYGMANQEHWDAEPSEGVLP